MSLDIPGVDIVAHWSSVHLSLSPSNKQHQEKTSLMSSPLPEQPNRPTLCGPRGRVIMPDISDATDIVWVVLSFRQNKALVHHLVSFIQKDTPTARVHLKTQKSRSSCLLMR